MIEIAIRIGPDEPGCVNDQAKIREPDREADRDDQREDDARRESYGAGTGRVTVVESMLHFAQNSAIVRTSTLALGLALAITAYGGILRLNVLSSRYGVVDHPWWARVLTARVAPIARVLEPRIYAWPRVEQPYAGGDPINYLRFGREMQSFYQAHVREPVFPATVRLFLGLLQDQDIALSFASAAMSTLAIFGTFLLGRRAFGAPVGVLAALGWAIDYDAVSWAPDGWRDDTFTCALVFATWSLVRLLQDPRRGNAVLAGVFGAAACLTRITAVSFLSVVQGDDRRRRLQLSALAAGVMIILVAPYLINCWRATGDPLMSINAHTKFYRAREGVDFSQPMNAFDYVTHKLTRRPFFQLDTAVTGLFVFPMRNKWSGFNLWVPGLSSIAMWLSVAGLGLFLLDRTGRLLAVVALASLVPYAFTWNVPGGGEWRFTMHAYPLFFVAAAYAVVWLLRSAKRIPHLVPVRWSALRPAVVGAAGVGLLVVLAIVGYMSLPYFVARESLQYGLTTSIDTGERDWIFYRQGWSATRREGAVVARVVIGDRATIRFPIPERRAYRLTLRADPATPERPRRVVLWLNGRLLFPFGLGFDPSRVGTYSVDVSADLLRQGSNELRLVTDATVPASTAGPRYAWLPPTTSVSLRVWYLRLDPS